MFHDIRRGWLIAYDAYKLWLDLMYSPTGICFNFPDGYEYKGYDPVYDYHFQLFEMLSADHQYWFNTLFLSYEEN